MTPQIHPLVGLIRRFSVDWLGRADPSVCAEIMDPAYEILIGGHTLAGRDDEYVPATMAQLNRFPGLLLTAHTVITDGERVAIRFTEHGPSAADEMAPAAWTGIGIFAWDGERLTRNATEEDYHSRRRQLATRTSDPVDHPAAAPWSAAPQGADTGAETLVREWLEGGDLGRSGTVRLDDGWCGRGMEALLGEPRTEVRELFSAGRSVAFALDQSGRYLGGLPDTGGLEGVSASHSATGLVHVGDDGTVTGHVVRDRVGLRRAVRA